jgi:uncharacterized protein YgfB (UPF0149 family)
MNIYIIAGIALVVAGAVGFVIWHSKWLFGLGEKQGTADQRFRDVEGAIKAEQEMAEIVTRDRDREETKKALRDGEF